MDHPDSTTEPEIEAEAVPDEGQDLAVDDEADEAQSRLWVRTLTPLITLRSRETDPSSRVQFALDMMCIAACDRIARILRSDLGA